MNIKILTAVLLAIMLSCNFAEKQIPEQNINGTWLLLSSIATTEDSSITENLQGQKMIKIITDTHFAFFRHDLNKGLDSAAVFVAGGGTCSFNKNKYSENLEYCNYREWEGLEVEFKVSLANDTLVLSGMEEIEELGIKQVITETFVKIVH